MSQTVCTPDAGRTTCSQDTKDGAPYFRPLSVSAAADRSRHSPVGWLAVTARSMLSLFPARHSCRAGDRLHHGRPEVDHVDQRRGPASPAIPTQQLVGQGWTFAHSITPAPTDLCTRLVAGGRAVLPRHRAILASSATTPSAARHQHISELRP